MAANFKWFQNGQKRICENSFAEWKKREEERE